MFYVLATQELPLDSFLSFEVELISTSERSLLSLYPSKLTRVKRIA